MKQVLVFAAITMMAGAVWAQEEELAEPPTEAVDVVLPDAAADCVVPKPPAAVADDPTLEQLVEAQGQVKAFQAEAQGYRECLMQIAEAQAEELSEGNKMALNAAHDATVDMEEQVAARFNEEVKKYKEKNPSE